jgi:hypothetical protein
MSDTIETAQPDFSEVLRRPSGSIGRDELGNAVWNWSERGLSASENLVPAVLTIVEDSYDPSRDGTRVETLQPHQLGGGYNPYGAGPRQRRAAHPKTDLRALSKAIEETRRARAAAESVAREAGDKR